MLTRLPSRFLRPLQNHRDTSDVAVHVIFFVRWLRLVLHRSPRGCVILLSFAAAACASSGGGLAPNHQDISKVRQAGLLGLEGATAVVRLWPERRIEDPDRLFPPVTRELLGGLLEVLVGHDFRSFERASTLKAIVGSTNFSELLGRWSKLDPPPKLDAQRPWVLSIAELIQPSTDIARLALVPYREDPDGVAGLRHQLIIPCKEPAALASWIVRLASEVGGLERGSAKLKFSGSVETFASSLLGGQDSATGWLAIYTAKDAVRVEMLTHEARRGAPTGEDFERFRAAYENHISRPPTAAPLTPARRHAITSTSAFATIYLRTWRIPDVAAWNGAFEAHSSGIVVHHTKRREARAQALAMGIAAHRVFSPGNWELLDHSLSFRPTGVMRMVGSLTDYGAQLLAAGRKTPGAAWTVSTGSGFNLTVNMDLPAAQEMARPVDERRAEALSWCGLPCLFASAGQPLTLLRALISESRSSKLTLKSSASSRGSVPPSDVLSVRGTVDKWRLNVRLYRRDFALVADFKAASTDLSGHPPATISTETLGSESMAPQPRGHDAWKCWTAGVEALGKVWTGQAAVGWLRQRRALMKVAVDSFTACKAPPGTNIAGRIQRWHQLALVEAGEHAWSLARHGDAVQSLTAACSAGAEKACPWRDGKAPPKVELPQAPDAPCEARALTPTTITISPAGVWVGFNKLAGEATMKQLIGLPAWESSNRTRWVYDVEPAVLASHKITWKEVVETLKPAMDLGVTRFQAVTGQKDGLPLATRLLFLSAARVDELLKDGKLAPIRVKIPADRGVLESLGRRLGRAGGDSADKRWPSLIADISPQATWSDLQRVARLACRAAVVTVAAE